MKLRAPKWFYLFFMAGVVSIALRYLLDSRFGHTGVFYVAIPFLIGLALHHFVPAPEPMGYGKRAVKNFLHSTVFFLALSGFLFEGFICILFAMPIYYIIMFSAYGFAALYNNHRTRVPALIIPALVMGLSLEGTIPALTAPRENQVTHTVTVDASIAAIKAHMAQPIQFEKPRPLLISVFPKPTDIKAGTLNQGDVHEMTFVYRRWFFTNVHTGQMHLRLDEVGDHHIRTSITRNDSYLSGYMSIDGTRVDFTERADGKTDVSLTLYYERKLDPVWYFGPLQQAAMAQSAKYLIETVIVPPYGQMAEL
ncbi:hypothetical protein [Parasulfitobacter algicola]|uniref:Polyketide cyclase/dehydrase n=1 Tax=Parasulfitobacter algicola TaxID=2614809 RepID=A0ABX2IRE7_9RHOB|nr:hypothetical protein [Sulfitobacter algicola]NSX55459.1 hypothetical protein [Sulfitobacter algicola]